MLKYFLFVVLLVQISLNAKSVIENQIDKEKKTLQLSSCKDKVCVEKTTRYINSYDYITVMKNGYYVTYIVNIDKQKEDTIMSSLKDRFPNMILRKKFDGALKVVPLEEKLKSDTTKKEEQTKTTTQKSTNKFVETYKEALTLYKEKKYDRAYFILEKLINLKPDDLNINFYLGRSAFESKRYDEAVSAFERFLFVEPDNNRVKLEMARAFFMTQTYKEAKKLFLEVKEDPKLPEKTKLVVEAYLKAIDQKVNKHFISGILIGGIYYDSNINSSSSHGTFSNVYIESFDTFIDMENSTEHDSALYNQEIALVNYYYKKDDTTKIKQDFMVYNKDSFIGTYNTTDVTLYSYTPALSVQHTDKLSIDYGLYGDIMWYGGDKYLKTYALYPKATYIYNKINIINTSLKVQNKLYQQEAYKYKDSYYTELTTSLTHVYDSKWTFTPSVKLMDEEKKTGDTVGVDYSAVNISFASAEKYKANWIFTPSISYTYSRYEGIDSYYLVQQKDREYKFALSSTYVYSPSWVIQGSADTTFQTSTIQSEEYNKFTFTVNFIRLLQ